MTANQLAEQQRRVPVPESVPLKAAIYARHSSSKQNPKSCDEQIAHIRYLVGKGEVNSRLYSGRLVEICAEWVVKDEAISGRTANREGYQVIVDAMSGKKPPFDLLIVDDLTRTNRDLGNTLQLYELAQFSKVEIISVSDNLSSADPNARVYFTVKGMIGDWSNEAHAMRTLRGMEAKVLKGLSCGDTPYGYKSIPTRFDKEGVKEIPRDFKIVIDEEKAAVIRKIFKLFAEGHGRAAICKILNDEKVPWPGFFSDPPKGTGWSATTLFKILNNQKYVGVWSWKQSTYKYNPTTGKKVRQSRPEHEWVSHHEGDRQREDLRIVPQQLWNKVHKVFEKIHEDKNHGHWGRYVSDVPQHMLSGLLRCEKCGGNVVLITGEKGGFYGCFEAHRKGTCSQKRLVRRAKIENAVVNHILGILSDERVFEKAADHYNELMREKMSHGRENIHNYERELATTEIELKHASEAIMRGAESETLLKAIEGKEKRKRYLQYQIRQIEASRQEQVYVTPAAMREKFKRLAESLNRQPKAAHVALQKIIPEGLSMLWDENTWTIKGLMNVSNKGGLDEVKIVLK